jgi:hypothetical protein
MLYEADNRIGPSLGVFNRQIEAIEAKEVPQRFEGRTLVALLKRTRLRDAVSLTASTTISSSP